MPAIDEELDAGDEACIVGSQEDGGAGDVIGITDTPERDGGSHGVEQALLLRGVGTGQINKTRRLDRAWADDVHADTASLQVERPAPGEVRTAAFEAL